VSGRDQMPATAEDPQRERPNPPAPEASSEETAVVSPETQLVIALLARRWSLPILGALQAGTLRHYELRRRVGDVADKVLVETLRALEDENLVNRAAYAEVPLRVEYSLTEDARELCVSLAPLDDWARRHHRG